jgi:hypothetical protein
MTDPLDEYEALREEALHVGDGLKMPFAADKATRKEQLDDEKDQEIARLRARIVALGMENALLWDCLRELGYDHEPL